MKLCTKCRVKLTHEIRELRTPLGENSDEVASEASDAGADEEQFTLDIENRQEAETSIETIYAQVSSAGQLNERLKRRSADRRTEEAKKIILEVQNGMVQAFNVAYGTSLTENDVTELEKTVDDHVQLLQELKIRFDMCTTMAERKQLLTLAPSSWSLDRTAQYFGCSVKLARKAKQLKDSSGILPPLQKKIGKRTSDFLMKKVFEFYLNDENTRQCPGQKDFVSVDGNHPCLKICNMLEANEERNKKKVHVQKRLLLASLKELHAAFIKENEDDPSLKIGKTKFAELKPPWCVSPGSSATHNICVCIHHQNPKLMISAMNTSENANSLMTRLVCSMDNEDCMLRKCKMCPTTGNLVKLLESNLLDLETVTYKQWISTDRTQLADITESVTDYIETLGIYKIY